MNCFYVLKSFIRKSFLKKKAAQIQARDPRVLDFELWAFGFPLPANKLEKLQAWNKLHGQKLLLEEDPNQNLNLHEMYELYLEEKESFYGKSM